MVHMQVVSSLCSKYVSRSGPAHLVSNLNLESRLAGNSGLDTGKRGDPLIWAWSKVSTNSYKNRCYQIYEGLM